jgi:hypothetical protein
VKYGSENLVKEKEVKCEIFTSLGFVGPSNQNYLTFVLSLHETKYYIGKAFEKLRKVKGPVRPRGRVIIREIIIREIITPLEVESENLFCKSLLQKFAGIKLRMQRPTHPGWMLGSECPTTQGGWMFA